MTRLTMTRFGGTTNGTKETIMGRARLLNSVLAAAGFLAAVLPMQAQGADLFMKEPSYNSANPECEAPRVLSRITDRFRHQVTHVPHLPDVTIVAYHNIHQHRYLPAEELRPIGRRYCMATAEFASGEQRSVWYMIEEGMGFASIGDGVEFCVSGFDRWNVYNSGCRILR